MVACLGPGCEPPAPDADQFPIALEALVASGTPAAGELGARVYRRTCIACHGADGRGNDQRTGANFTLPDGVLTEPDAELLRTIREGEHGKIGVMPPHEALLTAEETVAVLAYVRGTFGKGIVPRSALPEPSASP